MESMYYLISLVIACIIFVYNKYNSNSYPNQQTKITNFYRQLNSDNNIILSPKPEKKYNFEFI